MSLPDPHTITGKGTTLKAAIAFVESRWGQGGVDKVLSDVDRETRKLLSGLYLPSSRYPLRHLVALCESIDRVHGRGDLDLCWEIGKFAGDFELKLLHRVFLKVGSLQYWLKMAGATWGMYYSAGVLTPMVGDNGGEITLSNFHPISKAFCYRFGGWVWRAVEHAKHTGVKLQHPECVLDGKDKCVWTGTWIK